MILQETLEIPLIILGTKKPIESLCLHKTLDEISNHTPIMDWSKEARHTSEAIQISPTSMTIPCSIEGNNIDALYDPTATDYIIPECLMDTLMGNKPLTPTDTYFRSPSGLFFKYQGIARDVPITIDKIEVCLDFISSISMILIFS